MSSSPPQREITLSRASIGIGLGFIGLIGLLGAAITFTWFLTFNRAVLVSLVVGLVGFVAWAVVAPREFVSTLSGRQARYSTGVVFATVLMIGVVALAYIITARANLGVDTTASGSFSLSQTSLDVIDRIPEGRTARIVGFYSANALAQRQRDDQFLQRYATESDGQIEVEYIDPNQNPAVAQSFGITEDGETILYLLDDNGNIDERTLTYVNREDKQERYITTAINRMLNERVYTVYFDESRTNLSIYEETQQGLTLINNTLGRNGIQTDTLDLLTLADAGERIPTDAAVLVMARPVLPYLEEEVALIGDYLARGGSLLILADVTFNENPFMAEGSAFSEYLFINYGIRPLDAVVVDPLSNIQTPLDLIGYATFTEPPIGATLPTTPTFFRIARALEVSADKPATVANGRIIAQSEASYGERDLAAVSETDTYDFDPDTDIPGPIDIAAWAWDEGGNDSKVVLIGDGDFAMNGIINSGAVANEALIIESITWLSGVDTEITFGFAANPSGVPTIFISGQQLDVIGILTIAVIPLAVLLIGIIVWYRRAYA